VDPHSKDGLEAFALVEYRALLRFARALCGDASDAQDLVQSAMLRLASAWHRLDDPSAAGRYARRVIVNQDRNRWRRVRRRERLTGSVPDDAALGAHDVELRDLLDKALRHLGPRQRAIVVLRYCEDRSVQEVAQLMDCSVGTVKSQAARALTKLERVLADLNSAQSQEAR
jgi:RNA polymerase sigma-70 factor (sigma-E family)